MEPAKHQNSDTNRPPLTWDDLSTLLNYSTEAVVVYDEGFHFMYLNAEAERQMLLPAEELIGKTVWDVFPNTASPFHEPLSRAMRERIPNSFEVEYAPTGAWTEGRCVPISLADKPKSQALAVFFRDITRQHDAVEALHASEERLRQAVEGAEIGTWHWDIPENDLVWSDTTRALLGLPEVDIPTYELFMNAIHPDDREATHLAVSAAVESKAGYNVEYRAIWPDGTLRWHISRGRCFYNDQGVAFRMEGILIDITDRKRAEEELGVSYERERLLNQIGRAIRTSRDPEVIKSTAVHLLGQALGVDRCYFAVYNLDRGVVTVASDWHRGDLPSIKGVHPFTNTVEMFAELYKDSNTSVVVDAYRSTLSAQTIANMKGLQLRSRLSVALVEPDGLMATLTAAMSDVPPSVDSR